MVVQPRTTALMMREPVHAIATGASKARKSHEAFSQTPIRDFWEMELDTFPVTCAEATSISTDSESSSSDRFENKNVDFELFECLEQVFAEEDADSLRLAEKATQQPTTPASRSPVPPLPPSNGERPLRSSNTTGYRPRRHNRSASTDVSEVLLMVMKPAVEQKLAPLAPMSRHRRVHSCDDSLLVAIPHIHHSVGICA